MNTTPTPEQIAARNSPETQEIETIFAYLLARGFIKAAGGEKWSERTGRMVPIYFLTPIGARFCPEGGAAITDAITHPTSPLMAEETQGAIWMELD
jgi:hypothetical protein